MTPLKTHSAKGVSSTQLLRTGMLTLFAISAHNLPEGLVTFFATLESPALGAPLAVAIAIYNATRRCGDCLAGIYGHGP